MKSVGEEDQAETASEAHKEELDALKKRLKELREKSREQKAIRPGRRPLPPDLPRETIRIPVPDEQRRCDDCGAEKSAIGVATSSVLEFIPARFKVIVYEREKMACRKCEAGVVCAPAADKPIDGGLPGPGLLAHLAVSKYLEHSPLHRLSNYYKRLGVALPASTLGQWVGVVSDWLDPLYAALKVRLLESEVVGVDDTGIKVLDKDSPANVRKGHLWAYVGYAKGLPTRALFEYAPDRKGARPRGFLADRRGYVQGDGYQGLNRMFAGPAPPTCVKVGCMMHVRRYYKEALDAGDLRAAVPLELIGKLYLVEALATEEKASVEQRQRLREEHSRDVMRRLGEWARRLYGQVEPTSHLGKALTYTINQWDSVNVYLSDGRVPIDNGEVERRIRPIALGRRNWLFAGSDEGAERAASIYSLLACCSLANVEPQAWLTDVLSRLCQRWPNSRLAELLPEHWTPPPTTPATTAVLPPVTVEISPTTVS